MNRIPRLLGIMVLLLLVGCTREPTEHVQRSSSNHPGGDDQVAAEAGTKKSWRAFQTAVPGGSPPQTSWSGNVRHNRGSVAMGNITGDIVATVTATADGDLVQYGDTLAGPVRGTGTYTVSELFGNRVSGSFETRGEGRLEIVNSGVSHSGSFEGTGTGDLKGMTIYGTYENVPGGFALEGYILDPDGRL